MSVESDVAVLENKIETTGNVLERLAVSFEKISEVSNNMAKMLAVHQERFEHVSTGNRQISTDISTLSNEIKAMDQLNFDRHEIEYKAINDRLVSLESWKWKSIGMSTAIIFIIVKGIEFFLK